MSIEEMKELIIRDTILEVQIDPTERLNQLTDEQIKKEYLFLESLKGWD